MCTGARKLIFIVGIWTWYCDRPGGSWHPEYVTIEHLPLLLHPSSPNVFARKVDRYTSASLLRVIDRLRCAFDGGVRAPDCHHDYIFNDDLYSMLVL